MATKEVPEDVLAVFASIRAFLHRFGVIHFPHTGTNPRSDFNQSAAAGALGMSQAYVSDVMSEKRNPGFEILLALHRVTGAPLEEITGVTGVRRPKYPMGENGDPEKALRLVTNAQHEAGTSRPTRLGRKSDKP